MGEAKRPSVLTAPTEVGPQSPPEVSRHAIRTRIGGAVILVGEHAPQEFVRMLVQTVLARDP